VSQGNTFLANFFRGALGLEVAKKEPLIYHGNSLRKMKTRISKLENLAG